MNQRGKGNREKTLTIKIRDENILQLISQTQRIIGNYNKQLHGNIFKNLEKDE